ncbi:uncharacterized protein LOC127263389 isoform X2 [Andrographis paniculata]|uniref:uncharacterized protein LOC127263389 isoform X2 n=1 Tax=Andrographis paniculata TaxID=175694 RepID=UPI0021E7AE11|nr:uncharacterized protein LOC127263389 isoform X2 [Andrographis paniculata]
MGGNGRLKCRLWWPTNVSSQTQLHSSFLFGWIFPSSVASIDVVVAFTCQDSGRTSSIDSRLDLQEIFPRINKNMPTHLQDKSKFSLLGYIEADQMASNQLFRCGNDKNNCHDLTSNKHLNECAISHESWICGCPKYNAISEQGGISAPENMWIKLLCGLSESVTRGVIAVPKLDHLHWNSEAITELDLHVLFYDMPTFGHHHYSMGIYRLSNNVKSPCKKPRWFYNLQQKDALIDLDSIIQAINSGQAAKQLFGHHTNVLSQKFLIVHMFYVFMWRLLSASIASLSTLIYTILQSSHFLFSWLFNTNIGILLTKLFSNSLKNIHFRCCQLLYWPVFLQGQSTRDWSCVEFAEKAALDKHSIWSNVVVDVLLGNIFGISLWFMAESACLWISNFAFDFTNNLLRTGCVWLMGNPAGFKLNTELAGVLGVISLNAIQIWSTLWIFVGSLVVHFTKVLAICGIAFGLTSAAAIIIDMISLVTMHVWTIHLFLSLVYSTQIQAIASLWRLFRGKKWNPLRHRMDSYDYTVEQHVVGSLMFTPILLLLPTISVFYIFFTMLHTSVRFFCILIEATISIIHSTPYAKILLWLGRRKRFPSGIWFEVISCISETGSLTGRNGILEEKKASAFNNGEPTILVSFLHSNYLNLEVVWPHYSYLLSAFSRSSIGSCAYGLLTGRRAAALSPLPSFPQKLQWMAMPWKEYWKLCYDSVYGCRGEDWMNI